MSRAGRSLRWALTGAWLALASGCTDTTFRRLHVLDVRDDEPATYLGMPLKSGQIVLSEAGSPHSLLFSLVTEHYFDFTHAAVLVMENGEPWVYEMTGEYKPGIDDRPTDGIEGECRRMSLMEYARAYLYLEVFDPPPEVDREAVVAWVRARFAERVPFDPYFDYSEHQTLFCTEFVALALEAGGAAPVRLDPVRQHPSIQRLLAWLKVARDQALPAGLLADPARSVAALGQLPSRRAAQGYFAAKREFHRRFREDQQLGNMFELDGAQLDLRLELLRFLEGAANLIHDTPGHPGPEEIDAKVRALAADLLGEASPPAAPTPSTPGGTPPGGDPR